MDGTLGLEEIDASIKPDDFHFARTPNLPREYPCRRSLSWATQKQSRAKRRGACHALDRLFNAAIAQGRSLEALAPFDTVSFVFQRVWARRLDLYSQAQAID